MDDKVVKKSPPSPAQKPQKESASYTKPSKQGAIGSLADRMRGVFSNRTTAIFAVIVLAIGVGAGTLAVQRSTETRQHAATILPQGPCYPLGDVNVDGKVDSADVLLIQRYVGGLSITGTFNQINADVDKIGGITSVDALKISRYIAGLDPSFPGCPIPTATPTPRPTAVPTYTPAPTRVPTPTPLPPTPTPPPTISTRGPCYPLGDTDVDGDVDAADALLILRYVAALPNATFNQLNADVDRDGDIDSVDALKIQRYIAGLDTTFSGCGINPPTPTPTRTPTATPRPTATPVPTAPPLPTPTPPPTISTRGPCYPLGDTNVDGDVDAVDNLNILKFVAGTPITGTFNQLNADVDRDGDIDSVDALKIQRYIAGLDTTFSGCGITPPTVAPTRAPTPIPTVAGNSADIDRNGIINIIDFNLWLRAFQGKDVPPYKTSTGADYYPHVISAPSGDVNILDFNAWLIAFKKT